MKTWMNKLGGVLLASLLTVMLNGKAFAEEPKSENPETEIHEAAAPALAPDGEASAASVATPVAEQVLASAPAPVTVHCAEGLRCPPYPRGVRNCRSDEQKCDDVTAAQISAAPDSTKTDALISDSTMVEHAPYMPICGTPRLLSPKVDAMH